ncbi:MAG: TPM domain-containing protein, partial [Terriglobales bacterium]
RLERHKDSSYELSIPLSESELQPSPSYTIFLLVKSLLRRAIFIAVAFAATALCLHAEPIASLHATNYVNDFAGVLDASTEAKLNALCREVDEKTKAQIAVVLVKSTDGQDIFDYGVALYQAWGIGKKGTDRGVLILLATQDRKYWIHVGYGLEPILPDGKVGGFGREAVPILRTGNYGAAVTLMTSRVASVIAQDAGVTLEGVPVSPTPRGGSIPPAAAGLVALVALVIFILIVWAMVRSGGGGYRGGGGGGGFLPGLLLGMLLNSGRGGYRGGGWGGGGFGGFGGGGGGFGGFGGGSTGGGGAGGSW